MEHEGTAANPSPSADQLSLKRCQREQPVRWKYVPPARCVHSCGNQNAERSAPSRRWKGQRRNQRTDSDTWRSFHRPQPRLPCRENCRRSAHRPYYTAAEKRSQQDGKEKVQKRPNDRSLCDHRRSCHKHSPFVKEDYREIRPELQSLFCEPLCFLSQRYFAASCSWMGILIVRRAREHRSAVVAVHHSAFLYHDGPQCDRIHGAGQ